MTPDKPRQRSAAGKAPDSDVMTVDELAERLRLSRHGVCNAIARNEIPGVVRIGRRIRISRRVIDRWLTENHSTDAA